jgi:hypothetical protein
MEHFEVWNEPEDGWAAVVSPGYQMFWNGTADQFYQLYLNAYGRWQTQARREAESTTLAETMIHLLRRQNFREQIVTALEAHDCVTRGTRRGPRQAARGC